MVSRLSSDQALRICAEARRYRDASQHPFSEAIARAISLRVHQFRGEAVIVAGQVNAAIALCEEHEFGHYLAMALILRGWASAQQGEFEKGIAEIQEGLEKERATGALCMSRIVWDYWRIHALRMNVTGERSNFWIRRN